VPEEFQIRLLDNVLGVMGADDPAGDGQQSLVVDSVELSLPFTLPRGCSVLLLAAPGFAPGASWLRRRRRSLLQPVDHPRPHGQERYLGAVDPGDLAGGRVRDRDVTGRQR
jgi:hypothetical protein